MQKGSLCRRFFRKFQSALFYAVCLEFHVNNPETKSARFEFNGDFKTVRLKDEMSLRNGMWHGLRNDIIMRNLIYGKWRKEKTFYRKACARLCRPVFGANLTEQWICRSVYYYY